MSIPSSATVGTAATSTDVANDATDKGHLKPELVLRHGGMTFRPVNVSLPDLAGRGAVELNLCEITFACGEEKSPLVARLTITSTDEGKLVEIEATLRNPQPMEHPGGNWDLGSDGHVTVDEFAIVFHLVGAPASQELRLDLLDCNRTIKASDSLSVFQASSGGVNWQSSNHVDFRGEIALPRRGYCVYADGESIDGLRAVPILNAKLRSMTVSIARRNFWQEFPASLSATDSLLMVGLFPSESLRGQELQGGEQKTFEIALQIHDGTDTEALKRFVLSEDVVSDETAAELAESWPYLVPRSDCSDGHYESLVNLAIEGEDSFFAKRETIDEYGWRNFGDVYGDHEAVYHNGDSPLISHYNNQYDCTLGFGIQYLRTQDRRWLDLMLPMADHAWDIDTYHTDQDKLLYNGGLFWHTYHYADAHTATHRSYPKQLRVSQSFDDGQDLDELGETGEKLSKNYAIGGGPAASHNYSTGWMLAYYLTGKERYKEAAINAADYVMRIDDGSKTPFKWFSRGDTGYSTCSGEGYYGPGRASGNSTHALLTGHELTGERKYLERAELLMRRTVHPEQDLQALDLLNAELRWFYTMYLQALGRYVDYKLKLGERDADFRYGVATLRHYARWMARHERPTLSEPENLQYPTETWAAQDMRKWHVLEHAARHESDDAERKRMWDTADFFFNYSVDYLNDSPTKSLCRPVVILLNFGWQREWMLEHRDDPAFTEPIDDDFGRPQTFVPQREIAIRRFKRLVAAGGATFVMLVTVLLAWLLV
jgi:hypothetical protein